jgi:hypothetical protein
MVTGVGGYWLDFGTFDHQEGLDEVFAHYGNIYTIQAVSVFYILK